MINDTSRIVFFVIKSRHQRVGVIFINGMIVHSQLTEAEVKEQMTAIGVDPRGIEIMTGKFEHFVVRIFDVQPRQAGIIKQEMLARGGEAAVSWQVSTMDKNAGINSLLLSGTLRQLEQLIVKLKMQPFGLAQLAEKLALAIAQYRSHPSQTWEVGGKAYDLTTKTLVMGIINLTPDSFSKDGLAGRNSIIDAALRQGEQMIADGADFLDIGAESTRPGAERVDEAEEERRLLPVVRELAAVFNVPISVDTYKPSVAAQALNMGAAIINDIWGLQSPSDPEHRMAQLVAETKAPVIVMHNQAQPGYTHLWREVIDSLDQSIALAESFGASRSQIVVDPGVGFAKTYQDNLVILQQLDQLKVLGCPILLGTSRKSVVGLTLDLPVAERMEGSLATVIWGAAKGANIVRVHDVKATVRAVKMFDAIRNSSSI